jgi:hypothetical protein
MTRLTASPKKPAMCKNFLPYFYVAKTAPTTEIHVTNPKIREPIQAPRSASTPSPPLENIAFEYRTIALIPES